MGKVFAVVNQKGGVGKTTTVINLGHALYARGKRVLLCDCDPQGNCTSGLGASKTSKPNIYDVIVNGRAPKDAILRTEYGNLLPSNMELSGATVELVEMTNREYRLKKALDTIRGFYDYIFIDCPPSLELLTLNALVAADRLVVPVQCEYFAMEGLSDLITTIRMVNAHLNPKLDVEGVILTMSDPRTKLSEQVMAEIRNFFGDKVYQTVVPRNVRISEAPSHGMPVSVYDKSSKGTKAYLQLASEFLKRERNNG
ncbi:MAG: ParA family protein [Firmicutes bacterium]|nr:ParA family protein [Bacillota bacterium]